MKLKIASILIIAGVLAGCAPKPEPIPMPEPIPAEITYDKMGNPVHSM